MLENELSNLLKSAYEEYKSLYRSGYTDTWYSTVNFLCKTLNIDVNLSKTFGRNKFKNELKKTLKFYPIGIILNKIKENLVNYPLTSNSKPDLPQKNTLNRKIL
jgi:hypothetical protein